MKKKKIKEERYSITPKGLMHYALGREFDMTIGDDQLSNVMNDIELYLRRNNYNAIILDDNEFIFATVEKKNEKKNKV